MASAHPKAAEELSIILFESQSAWSKWLEKHYETSPGVWLRLAKKKSNVRSVTYSEAVETALCYGWIDGHKKPESESAWLQKFTPRGKKSIWSKINREKALALIKSGQMKAAGSEEIERARKDGRWAAAYDSPSNATVPKDFQAVLDKSARAKAFFATLEKRNSYAILFRIQNARKPETRARKIREFIVMLERSEKFHP